MLCLEPWYWSCAWPHERRFMYRLAEYRSTVGWPRIALWVAGVACCLSLGAESASAAQILCYTNWVAVSDQTYRCSDLAWVTTDNDHGETIINLVRELSPGYRTVFNLYVIEGFSHREIAEQLEISEGTSKSQLARARSILQKKVTQYLSDTKKSFTR